MNNSNVSLASDSSALVSKDELKVRIEKVRREGKEKKKIEKKLYEIRVRPHESDLLSNISITGLI